METTLVPQNRFAQDIVEGLNAFPKYLSSKYFYDALGDKLFQQIMAMPEYYLTRLEYGIFAEQGAAICRSISSVQPFKLVELGAGDGTKTKLLLAELLRQKANFSYVPIDISGDVLRQLQRDMSARWPDLDIQPQEMEYFTALERLNQMDDMPKVILFLGSNIGNFTAEGALNFYKKLRASLRPGDLLLSGIDLKKKPQIIREAYNDPAGITKRFNLNLLRRINREFDANFDLEQFQHYPTYNPETGEARSYLLSKIDQEVKLKKLNTTVRLHAWESIHTEISKKYSLAEVEELAKNSGFQHQCHFTDDKLWFTDSLWRVE